MDERDLEILRVLSQDARIPWRRLAHLLGVSEATVYLRVRRLMEEGVIRGFTAVIDYERLGLGTVAFVLVRSEAPALREVRERLRNLDYAIEAYEISGDFNFLVKVAAPSNGDLATVIDRLSATPGIREVRVLVVVRKLKDGASVIDSIKAWWDQLRRR